MTGLETMEDSVVYEEAEETSRATEEKYRLLTENMSDVIWQTTPDLIITYVTPSVNGLLGYKPHELEGQRLINLLTPAAQELILRRHPIVLRQLEEHKEFDREVSVVEQIRKDGTTVWTEVITSPALDSAGQFIGFQGVTRDISRRKENEDALRQSEESYRSLFENMIDAFAFHEMLYDENGRPEDYVFLDVNTAFENLTGFSNVVGKKVTDVIPGIKEEHPELFEIYGKVAMTGQAERFEFNSKLLEKWFAVSAYSPARDHFVTVFEDITERKTSQEALRNSEQTLRTILATVPGAIGMYKDRQCVWMNQFGVKMFGYDNENEVAGQMSRIAYDSEEEFLRVGRELYTDLESGKIGQIDTKFVRKDGSIFEARIRIKLVDPLSPENLSIALITDITDELRAEQEREVLRAQLLQAQKMEAVGNLAGGIAHDFNNLLQIVLGYAQIMLASKKEGDNDYSEIWQISKAGERGAELVQSLMAFSRKAENRPEPINLNVQVERITKMLARTIAKTIEMDITLDPDLAIINADPTQVGQVLMNLCVNARDAMHDEGKLSIKTENVILDHEYCSLRRGVEPGSYVLLMVSDTGKGMDKETLAHIFEPFFTTKKKEKGTGLGLATVYGIVKQHGGSIDCYSAPGNGTTFKIYLPAIQKGQSVSEAATEETTPRGGRETLLFVDDEELVRDINEQILIQAGYTVKTASNGLEALNLYKQGSGKFSLVVLDLVMPKMGGQKCLEEILKIDPKAKVLITTGHDQNNLATRLATDSGARGSIHKPYDSTKLLRAVREILDKV